MPTNANTFNSRVTSEALEKKFRDVFPAQGGAELVQDLYASGVITPVIDFSSVAEGSVLPTELQQAWDFSTGQQQVNNATATVISNTGFWKVGLTSILILDSGSSVTNRLFIDDGTSVTNIWAVTSPVSGTFDDDFALEDSSIYVFLRAGDTLKASTNNTRAIMDIWYRQVADVNGNLVNPLGFVSS